MTETGSPPDVAIYTDGACDPNPGPGGWAAILRFGAHEKELAGSDPRTTNNRMELQAVIAALDALKQPCRVTLHTDSEYVQKGVTAWLPRWQAKGWKKVANRDLWEALDRAAQRHHIEWRWVRGHAGDRLNERVDRLAVSMIPRPTLPVDDPDATHIFTGVSCLGVTGPGGWAAVVREGDTLRELIGREATTSANRLHLYSVIEGLRAAPQGKRAHVYTPSDYVTQGAQQWVKTWSAQGWRTQAGHPVKHRDAWLTLLAQAQTRQVAWHCLKGEVRPPESQRAEELARSAARQT